MFWWPRWNHCSRWLCSKIFSSERLWNIYRASTWNRPSVFTCSCRGVLWQLSSPACDSQVCLELLCLECWQPHQWVCSGNNNLFLYKGLLKCWCMWRACDISLRMVTWASAMPAGGRNAASGWGRGLCYMRSLWEWTPEAFLCFQ